MQLHKYLNPQLIVTNLQAGNKEEALTLMVRALALNKAEIIDPGSLLNALLEREKLSTTGIGAGVAVPHCKSPQVKDLVILLACSPEGVDFAALDKQPCHLFFLLVAPEDSQSEHLKALAKIARYAKDAGIRDQLLSKTTPQELFDFIVEQEKQESG